MGNVNSIREEGEEWQQQHQIGDAQEGNYVVRRDSQDLMGQNPPNSPRVGTESPILFTPQPPMAPLKRPDELKFQDEAWMQSSIEFKDTSCDKGIPTIITWSHGGKEVAVEGSWNNWMTKKALQRSGKDFSVMMVLPSGFYQFRFIVDGEWRYAPDLPCAHDEVGSAYNILDLQSYVPDDIESMAGFEVPQSPESSYDNCTLSLEDHAKEPPIAPSHLNLTLLNVPSSLDHPSFSRPQHVVLNHLYIQKPKNDLPVVALGQTQRFLAKYVTVVLFKSLR